MSESVLSVSCPSCGFVNRGLARFCTKCGGPLYPVPGAAAPAQGEPQPAPPANAGAAPAGAPTSPSPMGTSPVGPPPAAVTVPMPAAGPAPVVSEGIGAALTGAVQAVTGFVRELWTRVPGEASADANPASGAAPGSYGLGLKPVSGKASDAGQVRPVNEDSLIAFEFTRVQESRGVPIGFYVVADGMGGHQAGEIASRTVNKIITEKVLNAEVIPGLAFATRKLDDTPGGVLTSAVKEANGILHNLARTQGNDMGTTLTAALLIGDTATIANVGDSRTYLWRGGVLRQISKDHSLVASLVQAGMLQPSQVRSHPQRNQVYRTLGVKLEVEVDTFTETLQRGDRLILCSDGLWEMVGDAEIARTVGQARSPQEACLALIRQANRAGGEDNVTVIVVKME